MIALWLSLGLGAVGAQEYRSVALADGRELTVSLVAMTGDAIQVQLPQGFTTWPLQAIRALEPASRQAYEAQPAWTVAVLPVVGGDPGLSASAQVVSDQLHSLLPRVPSLQVWDPQGLHALLGDDVHDRLLACGSDTACGLTILGVRAPTLVIGAELLDDPEGPVLRLGVSYAGAPLASQQVRVPFPAPDDPGLDAQIMAGLYPLLHLDPDLALLAELATYSVPGAPVVRPPEPPPAPVVRLRDDPRLSWVPVPGLPSLLAGDTRRAAMAWAAVVPATAVMVAVAGWSIWKPRQFVVAGVGSYTVLAIATNQVLAARTGSRSAVVGVVPLDGGAAVMATVAVP